MEAGNDRTKAPSQARGSESMPLLQETIAANLDRTIEQFRQRDALISCMQEVRLTYGELGAAVDGWRGG